MRLHFIQGVRALALGGVNSLQWVFWLNIVKNGVYCCYMYCSKLFDKMRKETEFWQRCCWNCKKKYNVSRERENWISVMRLPKLLSCPASAREVPQVHARGLERENNCGNQVVENEGKKMLRLQHFYNIFTINYKWLVVIDSNLNLILRLLFCA